MSKSETTPQRYPIDHGVPFCYCTIVMDEHGI